MSERNFDLNDDEQLLGGFRCAEIDPQQLWDVAVKTRRNALIGYHVIRAVRPEMDKRPMRVDVARTQVTALARQLSDAAVAYELPVMLADIKEECGIDVLEEN